LLPIVFGVSDDWSENSLEDEPMESFWRESPTLREEPGNDESAVSDVMMVVAVA
jgi:hypothetical protein